MPSLKAAISNAVEKRKAARRKATRCAELARKRAEAAKVVDTLDKKIAEQKAADKVKHDEGLAKLTAKQAKESERLTKKQQAERKAFNDRFSCVPPEKKPKGPRKSRAAKPDGEPTASKTPAKKAASKKAAKKATKKAASKKAASKKAAEGEVVQPSAAPRPRAAAKTTKARTKPQASTRSSDVQPLVLVIRSEANTGDLAFTVDGGALRRALGHIRKVHVHSEFAPYNAVALDAHGQSVSLHVRANLGELMITLPAQVTKPGVVRTSAKQLRRLVVSPGAAEVHAHDDHLEVKQGGVVSQAALEDIRDPPHTGQGKVINKSDVDPAVLAAAIDAVIYAMSDDLAREAITGLYVERHKAGSVFVATDGHRLVVHEDQVPWVGQALDHIVLEGHEVHRLPSLLRGTSIASVAFTPNHTRQELTIAGATKELSWTLVIPEKLDSAEGKRVMFPPYRSAVPMDFTVVCKVAAVRFREALEPLVKTAGERKIPPHAHVTYKDGELVLKRSDLAGEGITTTLPLRCSPPEKDFTFGMRPGYLLEAISHGPVAKSDVTIEYATSKDSLNPVKLVAGGATWSTTAVIMPFRI